MAEFDPDKFLEKYNRPLPDGKPPLQVRVPEAKTDTAAPDKPAGGEPSIYQRIVGGLETARGAIPGGEQQLEAGHGVAQGLAGVGSDIARGAAYMSPGLANLAKQVPGVSDLVHRARAFSEEPSESGWQEAGKIGGESLPFMFLPGGAGRGSLSPLGRWLDKIAPRVTPVYRGGGRFASQVNRRVPRKEIAENLKRWRSAGWKKPLAKAAGSGAVAGAAGDPEDPVKGAEAGAMIGPAMEGAGRVMSGPAGQWIGRRALPEIAWQATHNMTGMPFHQFGLGPLIAYHYSPAGAPLSRAGGAAMREAGRLVSRGATPASYQGSQTASDADVQELPGGILDLAKQLMGIE